MVRRVGNIVSSWRRVVRGVKAGPFTESEAVKRRQLPTRCENAGPRLMGEGEGIKAQEVLAGQFLQFLMNPSQYPLRNFMKAHSIRAVCVWMWRQIFHFPLLPGKFETFRPCHLDSSPDPPPRGPPPARRGPPGPACFQARPW